MPEYLVLVADQSRARTFTRERKFSTLEQDQEIDHHEGRLHVRDLVSDQPGVGFSSAGRGRDSMGDPQSIKDSGAQRFAHELCSLLAAKKRSMKFTHLVIAASPRFLGQLRTAMKETFANELTLELDKDLTQSDPDRIQTIIDDALRG